LPNYTDNMPIGVGTIATAVGITGGSKDAIVVSHTHTLTDPGHFHSQGAVRADSMNVGTGPFDRMTSSNTATATTGITIASAGSSGTNANLPPYLGINFIIKT